MVTDDQRQWTRTWLYPVMRPISRVLALLIVALKRLTPVRWTAHRLMDRLCLWFLRRFVSPLAVELLIRHFVIETNLLNFIVRNTATGIEPVALRPVNLAGLGDRAVIEHDINVYEVLAALDMTPAGPLDFSDLDMPALDPEPHRFRLLAPGHPDGPVPDEPPVRRVPDTRRVPPGRPLHAIRRLDPVDPRRITGDPDVPALVQRRPLHPRRLQHRRPARRLPPRRRLRIRPCPPGPTRTAGY